MKPIKIFLIIFIFICFIIASSYLDRYENYYIVKLVFGGVILLFFTFNLYVRRLVAFKPYFLSKKNIFTSKLSGSIFTDIPNEIIMEKIREVLEHNSLKIKNIDFSSNQLFVMSSITWKSWGENIYIEVFKRNDGSEIKFNSVSIFQMTTWGKNEENFNKFLTSFEESLTI